MYRPLSKRAFEEAQLYIPGGVNSPVRALKSVGETPLFIRYSKDTTLTDIDGNHFTDFCLSWGVFLTGHNRPEVNKAISEAVANGTSYGIPTLQETTLAKLVNKHFPSIEEVRFVNSGTEACMSAIRVARGATGRKYILKFEGCYHGHADYLLVAAGSGVARLNHASSAGVPDDFVKYTLVAPYNDKEAVTRIFEERGKDIAAVIVEPVAANMGVVLPGNGFLEYLREITGTYGSLLIFDEVITGFRVSTGGAQKRFNITPDLTTLGKIVGGGFPAAAFGGRRDLMELLAPNGPVYQAGTLSGNPVAMTAGAATIHILEESGFYERIERESEWFGKELADAIKDKGIVLNRIASMFTLFFTDGPVRNFTDVRKSDLERFARFFRYMLEKHIYVSPSQFETCFLSALHPHDELVRFIEAVREFNE